MADYSRDRSSWRGERHSPRVGWRVACTAIRGECISFVRCASDFAASNGTVVASFKSRPLIVADFWSVIYR